MDPKNIGLTIKKIRKIRGLSTSELAKAVGVSQQYISLIENNKTMPSIKNLLKIAEALKISPSILIDNTEGQNIPIEYLINKELKDFLIDKDNVDYIKLAKKIKNSNICKEDIEIIVDIFNKYLRVES